jgi:hypothetical protein
VSAPARLLTIAAVAKMAGRQKRTMARNLLAMHAHDRETDGDSSWLVRLGNRWMVNMSRLQAAHPALFEAKYVTRDDHDDIVERLAKVESKHSEMRLKVNGALAKVRTLAGKAG